jgi:hypothetical protein
MGGTPRPRSYDDTALFEASKNVIQILERHSHLPHANPSHS